MQPSPRLGADFRLRTITALIGVPILLVSIFLGDGIWALVVIGTAMVCGAELVSIITPGNRLNASLLFVIILSCFAAFFVHSLLLILGVLLGFATIQIIRALLQPDSRGTTLRYGLYLAGGGLYLGIPLALLLAVHALPQGTEWTAATFANNWMTDVMALVGGRLAGRHKLAPSISPGKTIEGAVIGMASGFTFGLVVSILIGLPPIPAAVAHLAIAICTVLGDLLESWIKRYFNVKDASHLLPGHGGLLDRVDGMLLASPAVYLLLRLFFG